MGTRAVIVGRGEAALDLVEKLTGGASGAEVTVIDSGSVDEALAAPELADVSVVFNVTTNPDLAFDADSQAEQGRVVIDLSADPAGQVVVPAVNVEAARDRARLSMSTPAAQAAVPIVAAIGSVVPVLYAETVASVASAAIGAEARRSIDAGTEGTREALETVGRAGRGKSITVLNPAQPPLDMRDTVQAVTPRLDDSQKVTIVEAIRAAVAVVCAYAPGYQLKQDVQFLDVGEEIATLLPEGTGAPEYTQVQVFVGVRAQGPALPQYAGNLDLMTGAAVYTARYLAGSSEER